VLQTPDLIVFDVVVGGYGIEDVLEYSDRGEMFEPCISVTQLFEGAFI
jgi:hypothetical protein